LAQTTDSAPHDWLDHAWGWAQVSGAILALVVLVIALISIFDAKACGVREEVSRCGGKNSGSG
jgi:hypothetical protein